MIDGGAEMWCAEETPSRHIAVPVPSRQMQEKLDALGVEAKSELKGFALLSCRATRGHAMLSRTCWRTTRM